MNLISHAELNRKLSKLKVLVVEDQPNVSKTMERMLDTVCNFERRENSVIRAGNGREALTILREQKSFTKDYIDLVLLDWNMPVMHGMEALREIRRDDRLFIKNVPVIMVTGESKAKDVNDSIHEGANSYLLKPVVPKTLEASMKPLLRQYWSYTEIKRINSKRKEVRYEAKDLAMNISVIFSDDAEEDATLIDISNKGAKVLIETPTKFNITAISFQSAGSQSVETNKIGIEPFFWDKKDGAETIEVSMLLMPTSKTQAVHKKWKEWVQIAQKKEAKLRSKQD